MGVEHARARWSSRTIAMGAGLLVAITAGYAFYAHRTLIETRTALEQAQARIAHGDVPVLGLDPPPADSRSRLPIVLTVDEPIQWTFHYSNYGKSPALRITGKWFVFPGVNANADVDTFFSALPERLPGASAGTVAMPNVIGEHAVTAQSRDVATPEDFTNSSHDGGLYLAGRFQYETTDGTVCRSDFCRFTLRNGGMSYCRVHNEVHCGP
jgi:hypothetical protein